MLETLLVYTHILAFLSWTVFLTSQTALARPEWINAAVVDRLVRVDRIALAAGAAVLATGLARVAWGAQGLKFDPGAAAAVGSSRCWAPDGLGTAGAHTWSTCAGSACCRCTGNCPRPT